MPQFPPGTSRPPGSTVSVAGGALPVAVDGPAHVVTQVGAFVEARLGWQVTDGEELPARVVLRGIGSSGHPPEGSPHVVDRRADPVRAGSPTAARVPVVLLVGEDDPAPRAARAARSADAVLTWPGDHGLLDRTVADLLDVRAVAPRDTGGGLVVAGSAGGTGATTVALVLAAARAWQGRRVLAVVSGPVPVRDARVVDVTVLGGHRGWAAAVEVPDVPGLHVVGAVGATADVSAPPDAHVVVDRGSIAIATTTPMPDAGGRGTPGWSPRGGVEHPPEPDVLVCRADRVGCEAVAACPALAVVVVGGRASAVRDVVAAAGGRPVVEVADSVRVRRATDRRRVPGALPGAVVRPLLELEELAFPVDLD